MKIRRRGLMLAGVGATVALGVYLLPRLEGYDPGPWLEDFAQLQHETRTGYANLEWSAARNGLDLGALEAETEQAIRSARTRGEAQQALHAYVGAFRDGHFKLNPPPGALLGRLAGAWQGGGETELDAEMSGTRACRALGFENRDLGFRLEFEELDGFRPLPQGENPFRAGVLTLEDGRRMGVLRLAHFGEDGYRESCARAWTGFRETLSGPCDGECRGRFRAAVSDRMLRELEERVAELARAAPDGLVVDVTGNGGGTNWADAAARVLTPVPLHGPRLAFIRHPHWHDRFAPRLETIERDLAREELTPTQRALLEEAAARLRALAETAGGECGGGDGCSNLVRGEYFATGALSYAPRTVLEGLESAPVLFGPSAYRYREGAYAGPLFVLVDRHTASAAEYFAAVLQDNRAATIVGERTAGVGCGYTNGGRRVVLARSGIQVRMPDCVRLRRDGSNEADGVVPDVDAGWSRQDDGRERAARAAGVLQRGTGGLRSP